MWASGLGAKGAFFVFDKVPWKLLEMFIVSGAKQSGSRVKGEAK